MKIERTIQVAVAENCALGESPVWDDHQRCLHFVDILSNKIYTYWPDDETSQVTQLDEMVGAIVPTKNLGFLAALQSGIYRLNLPGGTPQILVQPEPGNLENRFNDGKADSSGRLWIATMAQSEQQGLGNMYVVYPDLTYKMVLEKTTISNGLDWSEDDKHFYHVESDDAQIRRFNYEKLQGGIFGKTTVVEFPDEEGVPDGMTMDSEGMLWVAHFGGGCVTRRDPSNGEILEKIDLPVKQITSCVFGGEDLNDLYITTASKGLSDSELANQPQAGYTFVIKNLPFTGRPANKFG